MSQQKLIEKLAELLEMSIEALHEHDDESTVDYLETELEKIKSDYRITRN
jgi:hypothetical protein